MTALLVMLQSGVLLPDPTWEAAKAVMLTLTTAGVLAACGLLWKLRDAIGKMAHIVLGPDGKNGLRSASALHDVRLDELEMWRIRLDTAAAIEREMWEGPERRMKSRRLRDKLLSDSPNLWEDDK